MPKDSIYLKVNVNSFSFLLDGDNMYLSKSFQAPYLAHSHGVVVEGGRDGATLTSYWESRFVSL